MARTDLLLVKDDLECLMSYLDRLRGDANALVALLLDKSGQPIATSGTLPELDTTSLASLAAGNVASTEGLAQLVGEESFSTLHHEGRDVSLHINLVLQRIIMVVIFDQQASLGLVRLRVQQSTPALTALIEQVLARSAAPGAQNVTRGLPVNEISDEDIDALFG